MELTELRTEIDALDAQLAELFKRRMELSEQIALVKERSGLPTLDLAREEQVLRRAEERCGLYGREFFQKIMDLSKRQQAKVRQK